MFVEKIYVNSASQIRLLLIYKKGVQDDLTADQKKMLRQLGRVINFLIDDMVSHVEG